MRWLSLVTTLLGCGSGAKKISDGHAASGPFEIRWDVESSRSGAWFNNGGDFNAQQYTSYFSVYYKGKLIEVPTKKENAKYFWQALFLKDASQPAVLIGTHSMYLVTENNGEPKVTPLHEQDGNFATFQWLDSENGQPGPAERVYLGDDSARDRFLSGGHYLMVNNQVVLDVKNLKVYPIEVNTYERVKALDDYNAYNSPLIGLSPGGTQMIMIGSRSNPENRLLFQYALVMIDFLTNEAYAVPFNRTETRFFSIWDGTPAWLTTYFEWKKDKTGRDQLVKRTFHKLPNWQGRFSNDHFTGKVSQYKLIPVKASMLEAYFEFLETHYEVTEVRRKEMPDFGTKSIHLKINGTELLLYFQQEEQSLSLSGDAEGVIEPFGKDFDAEMAKGKYQEYFDNFK
jgi:hypothetical protein